MSHLSLAKIDSVFNWIFVTYDERKHREETWTLAWLEQGWWWLVKQTFFVLGAAFTQHWVILGRWWKIPRMPLVFKMTNSYYGVTLIILFFKEKIFHNFEKPGLLILLRRLPNSFKLETCVFLHFLCPSANYDLTVMTSQNGGLIPIRIWIALFNYTINCA